MTKEITGTTALAVLLLTIPTLYISGCGPESTRALHVATGALEGYEKARERRAREREIMQQGAELARRERELAEKRQRLQQIDREIKQWVVNRKQERQKREQEYDKRDSALTKAYAKGNITRKQYLEGHINNYEEHIARDSHDYEFVAFMRMQAERLFNGNITEREYDYLVRRKINELQEREPPEDPRLKELRLKIEALQ